MLAEGEIKRDEYERIDKIRDGFAEELEEVLKHARDTERQIAEALKALVYGFGAEMINPRVDELKERFLGERVHQFLEHVRHDVLENLEQFVQKPDQSGQSGIAALLTAPADRFGVSDQLGRIDEGFIADLTIFRGDPLSDVHALASVK